MSTIDQTTRDLIEKEMVFTRLGENVKVVAYTDGTRTEVLAFVRGLPMLYRNYSGILVGFFYHLNIGPSALDEMDASLRALWGNFMIPATAKQQLEKEQPHEVAGSYVRRSVMILGAGLSSAGERLDAINEFIAELNEQYQATLDNPVAIESIPAILTPVDPLPEWLKPRPKKRTLDFSDLTAKTTSTF